MDRGAGSIGALSWPMFPPGSRPPAAPAIRTPERRAEVAWFSALCNEDMEYLGVPDGARRSSFAHCAGLVRTDDSGTGVELDVKRSGKRMHCVK